MENTAEIIQENTQLKEIISAKNHYIKTLEEFIRSLKQKHFGASSEKIEAIQPDFFVEVEDELPEASPAAEESSVTIAEHQRKKQRLSIPADLPRIDIIHDLPEDQKTCPHDGAALKNIGFESHEQLEIIPAKIQVLHHKRLKYACPCCASYLVTADKPAQPIEKSIASPSLLAYIATQKYVDGLPLYRQIEIFKRIGIEMDRGTLATWMVKCGDLVQPLINLIHEKMLDQLFLYMDETRVQVLNEPGRTAEAQSFMWVLRSIISLRAYTERESCARITA
jgi:transposase